MMLCLFHMSICHTIFRLMLRPSYTFYIVSFCSLFTSRNTLNMSFIESLFERNIVCPQKITPDFCIYSIQHTDYNIQYKVYSKTYTVYTLHYTVHHIQYTLHSIQYTVYIIYHSVYSTKYTV